MGGEILPLDVFDKLELDDVILRQGLDDEGGYDLEALLVLRGERLESREAAMPDDEEILVIAPFLDRHRLDEALGADALGKLPDGGGIKIRADIVAEANLLQGDEGYLPFALH